jgi:plastocyanin
MKKIFTLLLVVSTFATLSFAKNYVVDQKGKTFIPHEITVKAGDTITFKNSDPFAHNVYTDNEDNEFDVGMQPPGSSAVITVKPGETFMVECAIHPNMLLIVNMPKN